MDTPDAKALRVVRKCVFWLQTENKHRLSEEGLFRIPGSTEKIKMLVATLEREKGDGADTLGGNGSHHTHDVAGSGPVQVSRPGNAIATAQPDQGTGVTMRSCLCHRVKLA
jgi:hypothetical protein